MNTMKHSRCGKELGEMTTGACNALQLVCVISGGGETKAQGQLLVVKYSNRAPKLLNKQPLISHMGRR